VSTDAPAAPGPPSYVPGGQPGRWRRSPVRRALLWGSIALLIVFWIWALFFAPKEAINKVGDTAWAARAEAICVDYDVQLRALEAQRVADLQGRADLVDESTDLLGRMLDDIVAVTPSDEKGQAIMPDWEAEYRILLEDRYRYADVLRSGENVPFTETAVDGVPITERIEKFTLDNEMPTCAPPRGSVV
jgi:hypothetical protein